MTDMSDVDPRPDDAPRALLAENGPEDTNLWPIWLELRSLATDMGDVAVALRETNALLAALLAREQPKGRS